MNKFLKTGVLVASIALTGMKASAQVYPYFVDFETDSIKAYATATPTLLNGRNWVMPGVFLGDMVPTSDKYNGQHAARMRRVDNTTGANGSMTLNEDLQQGIGSVTLSHGRYGSETGSTFGVYYSTNMGSTWTQAGSNITPGSTLTAVTIPINVSGPARISIRKADTSASRIDIDDILITGFNGYATNVVTVARTPLGANVPLATDTLSFRFNQTINKGTGNIILHNVTDGSVQNKAVTSSDVVVSGQDVTINNITLGSNKHYYVTYDSTAFVSTTGNLKSTGIYNNSAWIFSTEDTAIAPPMTSLNETFSTCLDPALGTFKYVSKTGSQTWRCGTQGHTDANSVYMNGGFSGGANDNEDWLITNAPINLSSTTNPVLEFWEKIRYTGLTTKIVAVSTNYAGSGDPALAIWTTIKDVTNETSTDWTAFSNISLSTYQTTPFYLAFKYTSAATSGGAQEWSVDDIKISAGSGSGTGISERKTDGMTLAVLGAATSEQIVLGIALKESTTLNIAVYDITGRKVYEASQHMQQGANQYRIQNVHLTKGLYVIRVNDTTHSGVIKAAVQ
ncbi:T9SS type A sorting domain-containing protein [Taibaiella lutea]|uniref:T9SS type A sorting domain-containing protein n=1 Tax=Taibaiella lutea TaxID=2608001 RepID=A0A5M6CH42_9BACT|nr:choice-of-anchor J domain-containing protein [Taibaiella lutea]KAA5534548.1 T9SS type A sorting domain-containing protein [Taibaiella lutea]